MKYSTAHKDLQKVFRFPSKEFINYSIDNPDDYEKIVSGPAYKDFTPRTMPGIKKERIKPVLNWLAQKLYDFIHCPEDTNFETWHRNICIDFCKEIKTYYGEIEYGKAQKIVNMSFKYLFILNDSQRYAAKFKDCHMAVDQYTLEWFVRYVLTEDDRKHISVTKIKDTSWSNLECGSKEKEYSYLWFQNKICTYLKSEKSIYITEEGEYLTPFLAEFYIWPEMKLHLAMEDLYAQSGKEKDFKNKSICEKIPALQAFLDELKNSFSSN